MLHPLMPSVNAANLLKSVPYVNPVALSSKNFTGRSTTGDKMYRHFYKCNKCGDHTPCYFIRYTTHPNGESCNVTRKECDVDGVQLEYDYTDVV